MTTPDRPFRLDSPEAMDLFRHLVAGALDIPPWAVDTAPPQPRSRRLRKRLAADVRWARWGLAHVLSQAALGFDRAGDRVVDGGEWLAAKIEGTDR